MNDQWILVIRAVLTVGGAGLLVTAGARDIMTRTIPNAFSLILAVCGLSLRLMDGSALSGVSAAAAVFVAAYACWRRGWLGGGDVKLLAAVTLAVPPAEVPAMLMAVTGTGAILGIGYWAAGRLLAAPSTVPLRRPATLVARAWRAERHRLQRGGPLPYAAAIAIGGLLIMIPGV